MQMKVLSHALFVLYIFACLWALDTYGTTKGKWEKRRVHVFNELMQPAKADAPDDMPQKQLRAIIFCISDVMVKAMDAGRCEVNLHKPVKTVFTFCMHDHQTLAFRKEVHKKLIACSEVSWK